MPSDPLGLQSNPLFNIIGKVFNPETYRSLAGKKPSSIAGTREPMPDYAGAEARAQAGTPAKKANVKASPTKGVPPVKKVKKAVVKAKAKAVKPNPFAKGKTEAPGMKS